MYNNLVDKSLFADGPVKFDETRSTYSISCPTGVKSDLDYLNEKHIKKKVEKHLMEALQVANIRTRTITHLGANIKHGKFRLLHQLLMQGYEKTNISSK